MSDVGEWFTSTIGKLSDQNYDQSFALYRLWFDIGHTHFQIPSDKIIDDIWWQRGSEGVSPKNDKLFHPTAHLILRFVNDVESDCILDPHNARLRGRFGERVAQEFFKQNVSGIQRRDQNAQDWELEVISGKLAVDSNLLAWWANSGYVEEATIRNHILQSLISLPKLYDHQAIALIILFKLAGATFEAYADSSVVDRCFELLKGHYSRGTVKSRLVQVRVAPTVEGGHRVDGNLRRYLSYGSVAGKVSLPRLYSRPEYEKQRARARKIPAQLLSQLAWDFPTEISNPRFPIPPYPNPSPSQRQKQLPYPLPPSLPPPAFPPCPISRSQIFLMKTLPRTLRP